MITDIVESTWSPVPIGTAEARALEELGERLVSRDPDPSHVTAAREGSDAEGAAPARRSAIRCRRGTDDQWQVEVPNRIGVIAVGDVTIRVMPKIEQSHFMYLLRQIDRLGAHLTTADVQVASEALGGFWEVLAHSYLWAAERLIRWDLSRDYIELQDELNFARGKIIAAPTSRNLLRGRMAFALQFDEFSVDTPLNRVVRAAAWAVAKHPLLDERLRRRARRVRARMDEVGELQPGDLRLATLDRRVAHYRDALTLAQLILQDADLSWRQADVGGRAWLVRTPILMQRGICSVLDSGLRPRWPVRARQLTLVSPTGETINPDLVFGRPEEAVGDVKYRYGASKWIRQDVYEVVAFGAAFRTTAGAIVDFTHGQPRRPDIVIGDYRVRHLAWDTSFSPEVAAAQLVVDAESWLSGLASAPALGPIPLEPVG